MGERLSTDDARVNTAPGKFEVRATASDHLSWVRTRLAMERTLMAWVRTGASLIGFGFTIVQFFDRMDDLRDAAPPRFPNTPRYLGLMLIFCGVAALVVSALQYRRESDDLSRGDFAIIAGGADLRHRIPLLAISFALTLVGLFAFFSVFLRLV
jgi:putative membrane protein